MAQVQQEYIRLYSDIAVAEMFRTGIPASIKLAQGMHESACGQSTLAREANNHFGIKCGDDWNGKKFYREDDDYKNGKLIASCFREFRSAMDSYIAHSDFLTDPRKANRYGGLFELDHDDYKGWAQGLSRAGYATDPHYARKIIEIIERYQLNQFDQGSNRDFAKGRPADSRGYDMVREVNGVAYVVSKPGDYIKSIADRNALKTNQLIRFNDDIYNRNQLLSEGTRIFVEPKRSRYKGKQQYHTIKPGEDMAMISQQYGVKLNSLLRRNHVDENMIPAPHQKIYLRGRAKSPVRAADPYQLPPETPMISPPIVQHESRPEPAHDAQQPGEMTYEQASVQVTKPAVSVVTPSHVVSKGDTLYSIARAYGLSVQDLVKMNNLQADTIYIGQKLNVQ